MPAYTHPLHLDPYAARPDVNATAEDWRAEQARLLAEGDVQRSHACGWIAWDLETRAATRSVLDVRSGTGPAEITRYGERCAGPEGEGGRWPRRRGA